MLARQCKGTYIPTHISALKATQHNTISSAKAISQILQQFFTKLYSPDPIDLTSAQDFLQQVSLPQIDHTLLSQLNSPITEQEIHETISTLTNRKAPGPNKYTPEFYKLMAHMVVPTLATIYQAILKVGDYLPSGYQAHIKLIAKKGKDPTAPSSHRPISLLNLDSKIISKMIANRLAKLCPP